MTQSLVVLTLLLSRSLSPSDEWIDTATQITAVVALLESLSVEVVGIASLYMKPNRPLGEALVEKFDVFVANCLRCKEYACVCKKGATGLFEEA